MRIGLIPPKFNTSRKSILFELEDGSRHRVFFDYSWRKGITNVLVDNGKGKAVSAFPWPGMVLLKECIYLIKSDMRTMLQNFAHKLKGHNP